jgi:2-dehydro-3-deoxyphosphogluconate aldolase / (4S)-4-hydroxy-2-oxoglutarate aldolase
MARAITATRQTIVTAIEDAGVVAVIRMKDPQRLRAVIDALIEGGLRAIEVTMTVPGAIEHIQALAPVLPRHFLLGAGTVLDEDIAARVIDAGAQFVVSPVLRPRLIDVCHRHDVAALPGCFTPTEILTAWEAGADIVKVFPATALGPTFFKDLKGPLPEVKLMPTGGVTLTNAGDWIRAGAVAVGVGTALLDTSAIDAGHYHVVRDNAATIVANVRAAKGLA